MFEGASDQDLRRIFLFRVCESKQELHDWILTFLGLDLPDCTVDEESNSTPMDMVWEVYRKAYLNDDNDFYRVLYFASRDSFKTLSAAILEVLMVLHLERDVAHMAAIEQQAHKAQTYVKKFFRRPYLRDFVEGDNLRETYIVRFYNPRTKHSLTRSEYQKLSGDQKAEHVEVVRVLNEYEERDQYIKVILCTLRSSNSEHVPFFCVDGDTKVLVRSIGRRLRNARTARGIFRRLSGGSAGGRCGDESPAVIDVPSEHIELLSVNQDTGDFEFSPVVRAQSAIKRVWRLTTRNRFLGAGEGHPVLVLGKGFVPVEQVVVGDKVVVVGRAKTNSGRTEVKSFSARTEVTVDIDAPVSSQWQQVLLGSLLGDCGIYKKTQNNPYLHQEQHSVEQEEYLNWKRSVLSQAIRTVSLRDPRSGYTGKKQVGFRSGCSPLLLPYTDFRKNFACLEKLGPLGLAVWYMDDGCAGNSFRISSESFTEQQNHRLVSFLRDRFDIYTNVETYKKKGRRYYYIRGGVAAKNRLVEICQEYIHPSMSYKFDTSNNRRTCDFCGREFWFVERNAKNVGDCGDLMCRLVSAGIYKAEDVVAIEKMDQRLVYDFTLANNHTYITNGLISHQCVDEVDVVANPAAYEEAKNIPAARDGKFSITMLTSTRKFAFGLVQKEINEAEKTGLKIRHWNYIDVTEACPKERHRPDLPRLPIYRSDDTLEAITPETYSQLPEGKEKETYIADEGYHGCIRNCKLFAACKGRLATEQRSRSPLLKPIPEVIAKFRTNELGMAKAQLLCRKPSTEGLVYGRFSKDKHVLTPAMAYIKIFGEEPPVDNPNNYTKAELVNAIIEERGIQGWYAGQDYGHSHNFVHAQGYRDGNRMFVMYVYSAPELEPDQMIEAIEPWKYLRPKTYGDKEDPKLIKVMKRAGWSMANWKKGPGSVHGGITVVKSKLNPTMGGSPELFFVCDVGEDPSMELMIKNISEYHWKRDAAGRVTKDPKKDNDDECDALRYLVMNVFDPKGKFAAGARGSQTKQPIPEAPPGTEVNPYTEQGWMRQIISEKTGEDIGPGYRSYYAEEPEKEDKKRKKGSSGGLLWDIG